MKFEGIDIGAVKQKGISIVEVRQKGVLIWPNEVDFILIVTDERETEIDLEWTDIAESDQGYYIGRRLPGEEDFIGVGLESGNTFTDENLVPGTTYEYVVILISSDNSTSLRSSNVVSVTISESQSTVDPDYQDVLDYATANNIPTPDETESERRNQVIQDLKASGRWDKADVFFDVKGTADPAFKLICHKRKIQGVAYGDIIWNTTGAKGNGTNAYIDTLYTPSTDGINYTKDSASVVVNISQDTGGRGMFFGTESTDGNSRIQFYRYNNSLLFARINDKRAGQLNITTTTGGLTGLLSLSRFDGENATVYTPEGSDTYTSSAFDLSGKKMLILANNGVGEVNYFSNAEVSSFMMGSELSAGEHEQLKTIL